MTLPQELELLNQIWELDRVFTNYLLPQQKLVSKTPLWERKSGKGMTNRRRLTSVRSGTSG